MRCPNCGAEVSSGAGFCGTCGRAVGGAIPRRKRAVGSLKAVVRETGQVTKRAVVGAARVSRSMATEVRAAVKEVRGAARRVADEVGKDLQLLENDLRKAGKKLK